MKSGEKKQSLTVKARTLNLTALYWSIVYFYQSYTKKKISETLRTLLMVFITKDSTFSPEKFWEKGVLPALESFDGDEQMQKEIIMESARWLADKHNWMPQEKHLKALSAKIRREAKAAGLLG